MILEKQVHPTLNAIEGNLNQKSRSNFKLTSIRGIFSGSPSKGSKPKSSNTILRNKVRKSKLKMMFGLDLTLKDLFDLRNYYIIVSG